MTWGVTKNIIIFNIRVGELNAANSIYHVNVQTRDKIILETIKRIEQVLKNKQLLARIGYYEFVVIFFMARNLETMEIVAKRLIENLSRPYSINQEKLSVQTLIGITGYDNAALSAEELLHQAEIARHKARQTGINTFAFFDPESEQQVLEYNKHIESVRNAIQLNQLEIYYQPKLDLGTGNIIGVEALLRWQHPEKGLLPPSQFLIGLDDHPIALEIGAWVLNNALRQAENFLQQNLEIPISINIASYQLQDMDFIENTKHILSQYPDVPNHFIMFEILETEALEDLALISEIIQTFETEGIQFSLDDFGTGYSSLTYLKELNTAEIKLDQSFIRDILSRPKDLAILKTTITLCKMMGRRLIAEGVETIIHAKLLRHLGCMYIQGYAIAKPMPPAKLIPWLRHWTISSEWTKNRFSKKQLDELLNIGIQHYNDFEQIHYHLKNDHIKLANLSLESCSIEKWLIKHKAFFKDFKTYNTLYALHHKQHSLADEIIKLAAQGIREKAYQRLKKLNQLRKQLLKNMITAVFQP